MSFQRILIAVDESAFAAHAAGVGIDLAKSLKAEVAFVHVIDPSVARGAPDVGVPAERLFAMAEREAKELLAAFRERATISPAVLEFLESGKPAAKIVEVAKNWPSDLIVMASHGRGRIQSLVLGSVAQGVLHRAPCPVLVVRTHT